VLALGMLTCVKRAFDVLAEHKEDWGRSSDNPAKDPRT
jgi:DNA polymerase III alpha subunit